MAKISKQDWWQFDNNMTTHFGDKLLGEFVYDESLAGPDGMHYHIWVPKGTTQKQLREIYDRIAANHDIVSLSWDVEPGEEVEINGQLPATLASLKLAVAGGSMAKLKWTDGQTVTVDLFSASAVVSLYDALAPANQAKFDAIIAQGPGHLMRLVEIAFGNVKGCKSA